MSSTVRRLTVDGHGDGMEVLSGVRVGVLDFTCGSVLLCTVGRGHCSACTVLPGSFVIFQDTCRQVCEAIILRTLSPESPGFSAELVMSVWFEDVFVAVV